MHLLDKLTSRFSAPQLTRTRVILALAVAVVADFLQVVLLPLEWMFVQQIVDVVAMGLVMWLLGVHLLLLPTFVVEFIPVVDMLPTWTACVVAVIALRKREQRNPHENPPPVVEVLPPGKLPPRIGNGASDQGTLPR